MSIERLYGEQYDEMLEMEGEDVAQYSLTEGEWVDVWEWEAVPIAVASGEELVEFLAYSLNGGEFTEDAVYEILGDQKIQDLCNSVSRLAQEISTAQCAVAGQHLSTTRYFRNEDGDIIGSQLIWSKV